MSDTFVVPVPVRIGDHLERHAEERPDQPFLVQDDRTLTYAGTKALVDRHSAALLASGVGRGDRVAMLGHPSIDFWVTFLATTGIGAIWLGLNPKYTDGELDHVVGDADPKLFFLPDRLDEADGATVARALMERHPGIERSVVLGGPGAHGVACGRIDDRGRGRGRGGSRRPHGPGVPRVHLGEHRPPEGRIDHASGFERVQRRSPSSASTCTIGA